MNIGQMIFLGCAGLIVLWQVAKGWRLGFVRQLVRFGALVAASLAAYWGAGSVVPVMRVMGYPDVILLGLAAVAIWLVVYWFLAGAGAVLFKRTAHQKMGLVWLFYGISGALMGTLFGLVLVVALADGVRLAGMVAEGAAQNVKKPGFVASQLVDVKQGIETSNPGAVLQTVDPMPKKAYFIARKTGQVATDLECVERLLTYPGSRELAQRPDIQALQDDPEVVKSLREGHYRDLLKNPKVVRALNDPKTALLFREFPWEKALDYALEKKKPQKTGT